MNCRNMPWEKLRAAEEKIRMEQPYFAPTVEESYYRLLAHIPGMVYRCRAERSWKATAGCILNMCWSS